MPKAMCNVQVWRVDGVAQTLLRTRVAKTTSTWRLSALPTAQDVSDQHFENSSYPPFAVVNSLSSSPAQARHSVSLYELQTIWTECEGSGDVVNVLTLLVGGVAQAFHDDRVVELRVQLGVEKEEGKDKEEQVEVEREKRVKEGAPWMVWRWL